VIVADPGSLRTRRWQLHKAGDHSLCRQCAVVRGAVRPGDAVPVADPVGELRLLSGALMGAYLADRGNAVLAREARMTLVALIEAADAKPRDDELTRLFADLEAAGVPAPAGHS
jgi:hypothetical protein